MRIQAGFELFPNHTSLGKAFNHSNFDFMSISNVDISVNETHGEKGITISPAGVSVTPLTPVSRVHFRIGIFDGQSIKVLAKDLKGRVIDEKEHDQQGFISDSISAAADIISSVEFQTSGNEELLASIGVDIV